jgi:hypothetical protein
MSKIKQTNKGNWAWLANSPSTLAMIFIMLLISLGGSAAYYVDLTRDSGTPLRFESPCNMWHRCR